MGKGKEELQAQIELLDLLVEENPCRLPDTAFSSIATAIKCIIGRQAKKEMSMEEVSLYFNTTPRTIRRWQQSRNFPNGHRLGHRELSFYADEIAKWKLENSQ